SRRSSVSPSAHVVVERKWLMIPIVVDKNNSCNLVISACASRTALRVSCAMSWIASDSFLRHVSVVVANRKLQRWVCHYPILFTFYHHVAGAELTLDPLTKPN